MAPGEDIPQWRRDGELKRISRRQPPVTTCARRRRQRLKIDQLRSTGFQVADPRAVADD